MTEQCRGEGSIQKLVLQQWKTVGVGQLILLKNKHNPTQVLLKLIRKKRNEIHMFQCKPKVKTNGKSLILKGTDTKKKQEFVLVLRFNDSAIMKQFQDILDEMYTRTKRGSLNKQIKHHNRNISTPPEKVKAELKQYAWDCELCTFRNDPTTFACEICNHPRQLHLNKRNGRHSKTDSINLSSLPPMESPGGNNSNSFSQQYPATQMQENNNSGSRVLNVISEYEVKEESKSEYSQSKSQSIEEEKSTIKELIIKIMSGEEVSNIKHNVVEDILLLCHNTFTDSETMLNTLLNQLCDKNIQESTARIRGVKMCESWISNYWDDDFKENKQMEDIMYAFIDNLDALDLPDSDIKFLSRIRKTFEDRINSSEITKKRQSTLRASGKLLGGVDIPKNYQIMNDKNYAHIAEQITLMDFEIFSSIKKREMTGQGWKKKDRQERAPHLLDMIQQFNSISKWVQCVVLQQKSRKQRKDCIEKFIKIAVQLRELRNFSACCAVNFGLSANVLFRLKDAWSGVSKQRVKQYTEIQNIYKGKHNWTLLRDWHKNAYAPSILHTGLFLQDLLNTDEGNEDKTKDGTVNFNKLKRTFQLIEGICMYQNSQYFKIKTDHVMQEYLKRTWRKQAKYNENKMYKISTIVKNKDAENKDIEESDLLLIAW